MLSVFRSNRAEQLAALLALQLLHDPPGPFETVRVVVNTWPTSRWLGEQLALELGGIAANLRFPFLTSELRQTVDGLLGEGAADSDPWRATELVWPLLELLPALAAGPDASLLAHWLEQRGHGQRPALDLPLWQLGRAIADSFDDLSLYRPAMVAAWCRGHDHNDRGQPLPADQLWQPRLFRQLHERLSRPPFGLKVLTAIERLRHGTACLDGLQGPLRLFGLSSAAPVQVHLLQALASVVPVDLYLLTPCRDLWQRCSDRRRSLDVAIELADPHDLDWLARTPGLEARFGRLGGEFQQLLEGTGDTQLAAEETRDLFVLPASGAEHQGRRPPSLLEQLQQQLVEAEAWPTLTLAPGDHSLEFHPCPGRLRQVQIVRDRLLQLLAADPSLEPRHILVMTPQVEQLAPLLGSVFGDSGATGVTLPWRLTDRSQQGDASIGEALLQLLRLGGERLTASALEALLENGALQTHFDLEADEPAALNAALQAAGFRWGLDGAARGGDPTHSLRWAIDRLLLGQVLADQPGVAVGLTAPQALGGSVERQARWIRLLTQLQHVLEGLGRPRSAVAWGSHLAALLPELFGEGGERAWELQAIRAAIAEWQGSAARCPLPIGAPVVAAVLEERLSSDSGRFGHRSGALTIGALEPMRAIPHRVIVLMGLDADVFPRQRQRPGFDLMERERRLGDPNPADQDRYVLMEALLSARGHLLIAWTSREERKGEEMPPATAVRQWLELLKAELGETVAQQLVVSHAANPLERVNFLATGERPPASCDRRQLLARQQLDGAAAVAPAWPLALQEPAEQPFGAGLEARAGRVAGVSEAELDPWSDLRDWLLAPQAQWLKELGLRPREWVEPLDDLEALELDERQRAWLLRQEHERQAAARPAAPAAGLMAAQSNPLPTPDWRHLAQGRGVLPPLSAAALEVQTLTGRWDTLQQLLAGLGEPQPLALRWQQGEEGGATRALAAELVAHGSTLVQVRLGNPRPCDRLGLWLELLLAAAAGAAPREARLIARDKEAFKVVGVWAAPTQEEAAQQLNALLRWRQEHRLRCWPVPPAMGYAYALAERKKPGSGASAASNAWEGGLFAMAEREEAPLALAFGGGTPATDLLAGRFGDLCGLALALWTPLLDAQVQP